MKTQNLLKPNSKIKIQKSYLGIFLIGLFLACFACTDSKESVIMFPQNQTEGVNPDTPLKLIFPNLPILGQSGMIRIYDYANDELIDSLDMSIPPGPKNTRTPAPYDKMVYKSDPWDPANGYERSNRPKVFPPLEDQYQHKYIGGTLESDVYHFYPVLFDENVATITLHNTLQYDKEYYVLIDEGVLSYADSSSFSITQKDQWTFSTKEIPPSSDAEMYTVSVDGTGDFNTVQGALEFIPNNNPERKTIYIKNGKYQEIVYFRNKENISIVGESREETVIAYPNNGFFNPRPNGDRLEMIKRFRNRRSIFAVDNSNDIHLVNFTILSIGEAPAQNEGLLIKGDKNIVYNVTIDASGDALQANGNIYMEKSSIKGFGDNVLGRGAVFFKNCDFISTYGPHLWPRNSSDNHGNVLVECKLYTVGGVKATFARAPVKKHYRFPYSEAVLINCALENVKPEGWGQTDSLCPQARCWEYNSINISDGTPADVSQRAHYSRQLSMENDADIIANYTNPAYVLGGWEPKLIPYILLQPEAKSVEQTSIVEFNVEVAAIPKAHYQWYKDGEKIEGETNSTLEISSTSSNDEGTYSVEAINDLGSVISKPVNLKVL